MATPPVGLPAWRRWTVVALATLSASWMLVDGLRALLLGDYARVDGELGPWALLVEALGVDRLAVPVRLLFVAYGAAWLAAVVAYVRGWRQGRAVMVAAALGSLWYLGVGTVASLAVLALLLAPARGR